MSSSTPTSTSARYRRLSEDFASTLARVPPDGWAMPSPCEGWTAREVVEHIVGTQSMFLGFVGRELSPGPSVEQDAVAAWDHARAQVQAELDDPRRAGAEFQGFAGTTTFAEAVDRFLCTDLVVHRWDLARSQGFDVRLDDGDMDHVEQAMAPLVDQMRNGAFGPEVSVPPDADRQTRFLAFLGRS